MLAIEQCLVSRLPDLFQSEIILDLSDEQVSQLVTESEAASTERARCREKLAVLLAGTSELKRLETHRSLNFGKTPFPTTGLCSDAYYAI